MLKQSVGFKNTSHNQRVNYNSISTKKWTGFLLLKKKLKY